MKCHPQVLHIGFSKCASTYLRALFRAHPRIHLVFKSGFFIPFLARDMPFAQYQALFSEAPDRVNIESDEHLTLPGFHPELGVRTTRLAEFVQVADKIQSFLPEVKIIMVIRNQASLIVSRYSEYLITGGSLKFEEFASKLMGEDRGINSFYQNYYFSIIKILEDRFPRSNLLVLLQEAMRDNERQTASTISDFLCLRDDFPPQSGMLAERRSLSRCGMALLRWLNRRLVLQPSMASAPPKTRVKISAYRNVVRFVRALDYFVLSRICSRSSTVLTTERRTSILNHFLEDNRRLQDYLDRDLSSLGYITR